MVELLWRGVILGFSIAAPVGPIGILCLRRSLAHGRLTGLVSGLGAATADAFYGGLAALGLTLVSSVLLGGQFWLRLLGGLFLLFLGGRTFRAAPASQAAAADGQGLWGAYLSTFFLTVTNPLTILSFAAIFAGVGLGAERGPASGLALVLGVFLGSAAWWLLLTTAAGWLRGRLTERHLRWVNRASGVIIFGFGGLALAGIFA